MRYPAFFAAALLLWGAASAQVPGYLGKRISIEADLQSIPALSGITANNRGYGEHYGTGEGSTGNFALSWRAGGTVNYAISRQRTVSLLVDYLKTGMVANMSTLYESTATGQTFTDQHYLFYNLDAKTVGLSLRKFNPIKGAIAPFGRYKGFFVEAVFIKGKIIDKRTTLGGTDIDPRNTHASLGVKPKAAMFALGWEFGENFIIKDRFLLNIGGRLRIPIPLSAFFDIDNSISYTNQEYFKLLARRRIAFHSLFTINVGGGFLF